MKALYIQIDEAKNHMDLELIVESYLSVIGLGFRTLRYEDLAGRLKELGMDEVSAVLYHAAEKWRQLEKK